jgi:hypothetical protein
MSNYNNYGSIAIAVSKEGRSPKEEWAKASKLFFDSKDSQDKNCPRSAFLGLCEQGLVKGIKRGIYLTNSESNLNKQYALIAVKILTNNATFSRKELWEEVKEHLNISKNHNSQMDVVIALFENKMIVL